jgi:FlaA1/EpsC-like NDP-sugar epimerase
MNGRVIDKPNRANVTLVWPLYGARRRARKPTRLVVRFGNVMKHSHGSLAPG